MWTLFVIDYIVNTHARDDYKYVRYAEYTTELECVSDAVDLYKEFTGKDICRKRDIDLYFNKRDHRFSSSDLRKRVAERENIA